MARHSNAFLAVLNLVIFLLLIIGGSMWLADRDHKPCQKLYEKIVIAMGTFILFISLVGLIGSLLEVTWLLCLYQFALFLLIIVFFSFVILNLSVKNSLQRKARPIGMSKWGYSEYRLQNFRHWQRKYLEKSSHWNKIKACIKSSHICKDIPLYGLYQLSPLQVGCCIPPTACGLRAVNATYWTPVTRQRRDIRDCRRWSNNHDQLCYNCDSCKDGVLVEYANDWSNYFSLQNFVVIVLLLIIFLIGLSALANTMLKHNHAHVFKIYSRES